jgi:3-isopropylmalate/(R)-2-methylmalate dehydratase small subunit
MADPRLPVRGRVLKYGDNINTDLIAPSKYADKDEIISHAMEGVDPDFVKKVHPGDILVAGRNFGSGSSRETAPLALKENGIAAVIAVFFARIFYRNAVNIGLPALFLPEADEINDGDDIEINLAEGIVQDHTRRKKWRCEEIPEYILELINEGGLVPYLEKHKEKDAGPSGSPWPLNKPGPD